MQKISELTPGNVKEVIGTVMELGKQDDWFCHCRTCAKKFRKQGKKEEMQCPKCGAMQSDKKDGGVLVTAIETLVIEDDSGSILLDLYDNFTVKPRELQKGDRVHILNGWCKSWADANGQTQLSVSPGMYGYIKKM